MQLVDIPHRDQTGQVTFMIDEQKLFDLRLIQNALGLIERRFLRRGDELLLRHHLADRARVIFLKLQIAPRKYSNEPRWLTIAFAPYMAAVVALDNRNPTDVVFPHDPPRIADGLGWRQR